MSANNPQRGALADHYECYYCKLRHEKVEAGGIYYCPNVLCMGPGAAWWRHKLSSFTEVHGGRHTVDHAEAVGEGLRYADTVEDPAIAEAIRASVEKWVPA